MRQIVSGEAVILNFNNNKNILSPLPRDFNVSKQHLQRVAA
jgi:hypothetical protein